MNLHNYCTRKRKMPCAAEFGPSPAGSEKTYMNKKTEAPIGNTKRSFCRPALLDIGESLSAYLQADYKLQYYKKYVNSLKTFFRFFPTYFSLPWTYIHQTHAASPDPYSGQAGTLQQQPQDKLRTQEESHICRKFLLSDNAIRHP